MICKPLVDTRLSKMNGLQRATESFRYIILNIEHWISPTGGIREWLRQTARVAVWLFIPAILVMPLVTFILWQITGHFVILALLLLFIIFKALLRKR